MIEADFLSVSYGFRPKRRAQDAFAEIHMFGSRGYQWVLDADIEACFDPIDHTALMVKAFIKAGVMTETGHRRRSKGLPTWRIVRYADDFRRAREWQGAR